MYRSFQSFKRSITNTGTYQGKERTLMRVFKPIEKSIYKVIRHHYFTQFKAEVLWPSHSTTLINEVRGEPVDHIFESATELEPQNIFGQILEDAA